MTEQNTSGAGSTFDQQLARIAVGAYDDAQKVRQSMMNRVRDVVRKRREGIPFDQPEDEKDEDDYSSEYEDENLPGLIEEMREDDMLSPHEYEYISQMLEAGAAASQAERKYAKVMKITEREPIYEEWLEHVTGVSTTLTARLLHKFGYAEKFDKVSNMWSYSGLAPGQRRRRGEKLGYDPEAKTLAWMVADCLVKMGSRSRYRAEFYDPYKAEQVRRMEQSECEHCGLPTTEHDHSGSDHYCPDTGKVVTLEDFTINGKDAPDEATPAWSPGHADARARRYLAKKFLKQYWTIARDIKGLDVPEEWVIAHGGHEKDEGSFEYPLQAKGELAAAD